MWFKQQKFIFSQCWKLETLDQGVMGSDDSDFPGS